MTLAASPTSTRARIASPVERVRDMVSIVPITIEQYQKMIAEQIVPEDSAVELLRGMLVRKNRSVIGEDPMGHSPLHVMIVALLTALASKINSATAYLQIQLPIDCPPDSSPEPDAAIIRGNPRDYLNHIPNASTDVTCVIEASHSSLERDREDKLPIYAAAGIPQYIIINLQNRTLEVHTDPDSQSQEYRTKVTLAAGQTVSLTLPSGSLAIQVSELLP
jgi:Uma2 family endonuclease